MNYQQAIAAVIKQIRFRSVAVDATATTVSVAGSGFLSFCPAVAATADLVDSVFPTAVDAVVDVAVRAATTMADAVAGSGFSSFCPAAVAATTAADAAAANILISEGPFYTDPYNLYRFYSGTCLRRA